MNIWDITVKDLCLILKDRGALYTLLALPIVFIAILGLSTGQLITTHDAARLLKIGVVDKDQSSLSETVFDDLSLIGGIKTKKIVDQSQAQMELQDGRANIVVVIGEQFDNKVDDLEFRDILDYGEFIYQRATTRDVAPTAIFSDTSR